MADHDPAPWTIALYHGPLYDGPSGYETYGPYARYIHEFARRFRRVVVFAPVFREDTEYRGCRIEGANVRVVELPAFDTHIEAARSAHRILRAFRSVINEIDIVNCRNTAPFGSWLYLLASRRGATFVYHFTSDPWSILTAGTRYRGLRGVLSRLLYRAAFAAQKRVMRRCYSFVNGRTHFDELKSVTPRIEPIISSTLTDDDFSPRADWSLHSPARLLYVGYLKHMKVLEYLVEAVGLLHKGGTRVELTLVGAGPMEAMLRGQVAALGIESAVRFRGYVAMGPDLRRCYDEADVFVFASLSEGSPRVVLEAMAHALPLISTPVGSVPDLVRDGESGLLVPYRDSHAIADAVRRYIDNPDLRRRCGTAAQETARRHTVDQFVGRIADKAIELHRAR